MSNFNSVELLDIIEEYASHNGLISSESELSDRFDADIAPLVIEQYGEIGVEFDDDIAMSEAFNDWTDTLCTEGEIHSEQCDSYEYTGKWSEWSEL